LLAFDPSALEQEILQLSNRFRVDPTNEYARLIAVDSPLQSHDSEVTPQLTLSNVDGSMLRDELSRLSPAPPLAWNEIVHNLATTQNGTMISNQRQEHFPNLASTLNAMGVPIEAGTGQNAFFNTLGIGKTPFFVHSAYVIDWANGAPDAIGGMQKGRGHRTNIINPLYNQVGSAITPTSMLVNTQFFAKISSAQKFAVGALFEDKNKSGWYEAGEGIGGAQIEFKNASTGAVITTRSLTAGGYQAVLPAGTYSITATGGGLSHPVAIPSLTIGTSNVWQNLIFDPSVVPPDSMEPNNSLTEAKDVGSLDQTLSALSIHPGDTDFFKFTPNGSGAATFELQFSHISGNLDLRLLDFAGGTIASAITASAPESITANVARGQTYYVQVFSSTNATNGQYSLKFNLPEPAAPNAVADREITAQGAGALRVSILDNDIDPDGSITTLIPTIQTVGSGSFSINTDRSLSYTPAAGFSGVDRASYKVTDDQGLSSNNANIQIFVLDFALAKPWKNARRTFDTNDDGVVTPLDALLVINELVARGSRPLPTTLAGAAGMFGFVDTTGSNTLEPRDALLVINELHRIRGGASEGESPYSHDVAIQQLMAEDEATLQRKKKR
jgi:hypothetical protein